MFHYLSKFYKENFFRKYTILFIIKTKYFLDKEYYYSVQVIINIKLDKKKIINFTNSMKYVNVQTWDDSNIYTKTELAKPNYNTEVSMINYKSILFTGFLILFDLLVEFDVILLNSVEELLDSVEILFN